VPEALQRELGGAQGLLAERFALCQALPLERLGPVAQGLRPSGYRPVRARPWLDGATARAAVVWTRDGSDWRLEAGLTLDEVTTRDQHWQSQGQVPLDLAGYATGL